MKVSSRLIVLDFGRVEPQGINQSDFRGRHFSKIGERVGEIEASEQKVRVADSSGPKSPPRKAVFRQNKICTVIFW